MNSKNITKIITRLIAAFALIAAAYIGISKNSNDQTIPTTGNNKTEGNSSSITITNTAVNSSAGHIYANFQTTNNPGQTISYSTNLSSTEVIAGNAYILNINGVKSNPDGCIVYIIQGPGTYSLTVKNGSIKHIQNVQNATEANVIFDEERQNIITYSDGCGSKYAIIPVKVP